MLAQQWMQDVSIGGEKLGNLEEKRKETLREEEIKNESIKLTDKMKTEDRIEQKIEEGIDREKVC